MDKYDGYKNYQRVYPLELRPGTEKTRLAVDCASGKFMTHSSLYKDTTVSNPRETAQVARPQTLCGGPHLGTDATKEASARLVPVKSVYGTQNPGLAASKLGSDPSNYLSDQAEGLLSRGRATADYFFSHLPKLRPETHDMRVVAEAKVQHYMHNGRKDRWGGTCYGGKSLYGQGGKAGGGMFRPNTGHRPESKEELKQVVGSGAVGMVPPQTAQVKTRQSAGGMMRLSTPQSTSEKRPDSRYNKATLCVGLNNGRERSPEYRVPVVDMRLNENFGKQAIMPYDLYLMPDCWKLLEVDSELS